MRTILPILCAVSLLLASSAATAADRKPLKEARSDNRRFVLRIDPGKSARQDRRSSEPIDREATTAAESGDENRGDAAPPPTRSDVAGPQSGGEANDDQERGGEGETAGANAEQGLAHAVATEGSDGDAESPARPRSGRCRATLLQVDRGPRDEREIWTADFVNQVAPAMAFVRDDGRFVVTLDDSDRGGEKHAVVVYGSDGKLLREFRLTDLLHRADWEHVRQRKDGIQWLRGGKFRFDDAREQFVIELRWGREVRIDLQRLEPVDERGNTDFGNPADAPPVIVGTVLGQDENAAEGMEDLRNALLAKLEAGELSPEAAERLAELLADPALSQEDLAEIMALVGGVQTAQIPEFASAEGSEAGDGAATTGATTTGDDAATALGTLVGTEEAWETSFGLRAEGPLPDPSAAGDGVAAAPRDGRNRDGIGRPMAGWDTPMPDPANPVNYTAWLNSLGQVDGPDAWPLYQEAAKATVRYAGDDEVYTRAANGDPEALASPEISAWLEANAAALQQFQDASDYPQRGWNFPDTGGGEPVIGILLPELSPMRELTRATMMNGRRLEVEGRVDEAMNGYVSALSAGAHVGAGPTLIENLVGVSMQSMAADTLLDSMSRNSDAIDYVQLSEQLESAYRPVRAPVDLIASEQSMALDMVQRAFPWDPQRQRHTLDAKSVSLFQAMSDGGSDPGLVFALGMSGYQNTLNAVHGSYEKIADAVKAPFPEGRAALTALEEEMSQPGYKWKNPIGAMLTPAMSRYNFLSTRAESQRQATLLTAQIQAYRQQSGDYPDSLETLARHDAVVDPLTGQPFRYERDGSGFRLYSLGANGTDDGGIHDDKGETNDVVYWPRPVKPE